MNWFGSPRICVTVTGAPMMMNAVSVTLMPATNRMVLRMTGRSPRRNRKLSAR